MFEREYGLVHNDSDPERYVRLTKWSLKWTPGSDGYDSCSAVPTVWEWTQLDVSNPRAYDYVGPVWKLVPTAITETPVVRQVQWPREAAGESESVRRMRIRALRLACHVDPELGAAEPAWIVERGERPKIQGQWMAPQVNSAAA